MNDRTEQKLREARTRLAYARPYYSQGLYAMRPVVTLDVPALAVDEWWRLYANPGWIDRHDVGQIATGFCHELHHLLGDHAGRARTAGVTHATMGVWNREAADPDINDGLCLDCQTCRPILPLLPPEWCVLPKHFGMPDGKTAEWYFVERMKHRPPFARAGGGTDEEDGGAGDGGRGRSGRGSGSGRGHELLDFGCGSGSTGIEAPWDVGSPEQSGIEGLDDADAIDVRRRVAMDVRGHAEAKGRGSVPLGLLEWANELLRPARIAWDSLLANALRRSTHATAGAVQHSYTRTSRRQHAFGQIIIPAYRRPIPNVAIVTDTSLSMVEQRAAVRGVVDDACRRLAVPLRVLDVDAAVHRDGLVSSGLRAAMSGGGGTDMRVGIERALAKPRPADSVVVVTDCETLWPSVKPPRAQIIVAAVGATARNLALVPSWATVIQVEAA